ncbi:murein L,D-transpeptidase [Rhizobium sp. LjRoot30]|uniref:L,D-transpeptidase family protein n=1 Tax=Rhizobium sp. LjRoot30 TaxID=3342320 RepID=UPI003ED0895A
MRIRNFVLFSMMAAALAGCNDTLDSATTDLSSVKDKVQHPLSQKIVADMRAKGMNQNSPIMMRIFKEEGVLEIWKAKTDNRFDKIKEYKICAWSGKLGPKVKEGDRQAPEGFYNLTPAHLNPNSKYYLAINTGFPNRFDQANRRNGTNLMIHGACSSSGCYSMTDEQVLEIYAFARDAFKGGQTSVQLQAFPFRMTAENMARHRYSEHSDFWKMLKVGYDNFEVTKRPPEVNVCEKKYVFNQQADGSFNPAGACPQMTTPAALQAALSSYNKTYDAAYAKALRKYDGMVWYDPTEAERKALVANLRKGRELAYAPTGSALEAGKLMKLNEYQEKLTQQDAKTATAAISNQTGSRTQTTATTQTGGNATAQTVKADETKTTETATVPIPVQNPNTVAQETVQTQDQAVGKPFWKFW